MQVLKLTYLAQGWMLGLYSVPLVWDDAEAWRYGPVFRRIYNEVAGQPKIARQLFMSPSADPFDERETNLIDQVWEKYGKMNGLQLSALTHTTGSPWDITYKNFGQNSVIPKDLIRDYYAKFAAA